MDEVLALVAETIKNFAIIYLVDITEVPDFNTLYELYNRSTVMFFFWNKRIMIDLGTGNNNNSNWALKDKHEFIDIVFFFLEHDFTCLFIKKKGCQKNGLHKATICIPIVPVT
jgi:DIM1 family U5 snRNP protein